MVSGMYSLCTPCSLTSVPLVVVVVVVVVAAAAARAAFSIFYKCDCSEFRIVYNQSEFTLEFILIL